MTENASRFGVIVRWRHDSMIRLENKRRRKIKGQLANPSLPGKWALKCCVRACQICTSFSARSLTVSEPSHWSCTSLCVFVCTYVYGSKGHVQLLKQTPLERHPYYISNAYTVDFDQFTTVWCRTVANL